MARKRGAPAGGNRRGANGKSRSAISKKNGQLQPVVQGEADQHRLKTELAPTELSDRIGWYLSTLPVEGAAWNFRQAVEDLLAGFPQMRRWQKTQPKLYGLMLKTVGSDVFRRAEVEVMGRRRHRSVDHLARVGAGRLHRQLADYGFPAELADVEGLLAGTAAGLVRRLSKRMGRPDSPRRLTPARKG